jgi:Arc/MetJ-type ribon-helix-helix transcriptional regulator
MEVRLSPAQRALARKAIEKGRFRREEDVVKEALSIWEDLERTRANILAAFEQAEEAAEEAKPRGRRIAVGHSFVPDH